MKIELLLTHKSSMKLFPQLTHGLVNAHSHVDLKISNENNASTNSAIDNETVSLPTQKSSMKTMLLPTKKLAVTVESFLALLFFFVG